jgi:enoyl-CoA hydratase
MGLTEIQVGVPFPASAMEAVRYACAGPHLTEVLLRGQTYLPKEAVARRLADEVVPAAELMPRALKLAEELAGRLPVAVAPTKLALRADALAKMAAARASGADPTWNIWRSQEVRAAMDAYRNKLSSKSR